MISEVIYEPEKNQIIYRVRSINLVKKTLKISLFLYLSLSNNLKKNTWLKKFFNMKHIVDDNIVFEEDS
eukprot:snap_masked-scaffold_26-processed-gene-3.51-mRNA-1 protein AED:1.00 eAED:1.00 QI:0/0/0/0/1/1/4/0/68